MDSEVSPDRQAATARLVGPRSLEHPCSRVTQGLGYQCSSMWQRQKGFIMGGPAAVRSRPEEASLHLRMASRWWHSCAMAPQLPRSSHMRAVCLGLAWGPVTERQAVQRWAASGRLTACARAGSASASMLPVVRGGSCSRLAAGLGDPVCRLLPMVGGWVLLTAGKRLAGPLLSMAGPSAAAATACKHSAAGEGPAWWCCKAAAGG